MGFNSGFKGLNVYDAMEMYIESMSTVSLCLLVLANDDMIPSSYYCVFLM